MVYVLVFAGMPRAFCVGGDLDPYIRDSLVDCECDFGRDPPSYGESIIAVILATWGMMQAPAVVH